MYFVVLWRYLLTKLIFRTPSQIFNETMGPWGKSPYMSKLGRHVPNDAMKSKIWGHVPNILSLNLRFRDMFCTPISRIVVIISKIPRIVIYLFKKLL